MPYMCTLCDSTNINTITEFVPNCWLLKPRQSFRITLYFKVEEHTARTSYQSTSVCETLLTLKRCINSPTRKLTNTTYTENYEIWDPHSGAANSTLRGCYAMSTEIYRLFELSQYLRNDLNLQEFHWEKQEWTKDANLRFWMVAGSIPDGVIGIFHWHNPSGRTMALGSTQSVTEMSTRNISWG